MSDTKNNSPATIPTSKPTTSPNQNSSPAPNAPNETQGLLAQAGPITLFEATFQHEGVLIRADVLTRDANNAITLIEVKASTSVKLYHLNDCAIQLWVLEFRGQFTYL